jgi:hypothetical protein
MVERASAFSIDQLLLTTSFKQRLQLIKNEKKDFFFVLEKREKKGLLCLEVGTVTALNQWPNVRI